MKTLKKTLCLVLAVVMVVGVLIIPAGAADYDDFTDKDAIEHKEAVSVLTGLGIIEGTGSGFDPNGKLNRAAGAVLIARMLATPDTAKKLPVTKTFDDVESAGYGWAAEGISYGVENGYISGHGNGKFDPAGPLTGYQLAKMLLVGIGYADASKYNGDGYETRVFEDAEKVGLFDDVADPTKGLTRDDAAQMMFVAMAYDPDGQTKYELVDGDGVSYGVFDTRTEAALYLKLLELGDDAQINPVTVGSDNILGKVYNTTYSTSTPDAFGRPTTTWTQTVNNKSTVLYESANTPVAGPYYTAKGPKDIFVTDLKLSATKTVKARLFIDGERRMPGDQDSEDTRANANFNADDLSANSIKMGGRGYETTVYKNGDVYDIYVITTKVHTVTKAEAKDGAAVLIDKDGDTPAQTYEDATLEVGDTVIWQGTDTEVYKAQKAEVTSGRITGKSNSSDQYFLIEGAKTYLSAASSVTFSSGVSVSASTIYEFVLDFQNNVISFTVEDDSSSTVASNYAYIIEYAEQQAEGGDLLGDGVKGAAARAKVFDFTTNAVKIVDIAVAQGNDGKYYLAKSNGTADTTKALGTNNRYSTTPFVTYKVTDDGEWVVQTAAAGESIEITKGGAKVGDNYASGTTVLHYLYKKTVEGEPVTYTYTGTSYIGYRNFVAANGTGVVVTNDNDVVTHIYVLCTTDPVTHVEPPKEKAIYLGKGDETLEGTEYKFYVDGVLTTFVVEDETDIDGNENLADNVKNAMYVYIEDGELTKVEPITVSGNHKTGTLSFVGDGYLVIGDEPVYIAEDLVIYDKTNNKIVSEITLSEDKVVTATAYAVDQTGSDDDDKLIDLIVFTVADA